MREVLADADVKTRLRWHAHLAGEERVLVVSGVVCAGSEEHEWVDVHLGDAGWVSLDPTHDVEQSERYVRVGVGRDYADVPPSRGVYEGTAIETLEVAVTIREP